MKLFADLHLHSCLSPCGHDDMTPNNIVNMAAIKGLDCIAVADHNSAKNLPAVAAVCEQAGLLHIPALEVQSEEDVHLLCYFPGLEQATAFGEYIYKLLPDIPASEDIFGPQQILDENDDETGREPRLLIQGIMMGIDGIYDLCMSMGGVCIPAHINKQANSLLYLLGFMPEYPPFTAVEISRKMPAPDVSLFDKHVLYSSDAHYLEHILEREVFIDLPERTAQSFVDFARSAKG